ncbi:MAG: hypothetical protein ABR543_14955 [Gemmatimonadaceae bacterium]
MNFFRVAPGAISILAFLLLAAGACGRASTAPPPSTLVDFSGTTRVVLAAWTTAPAIVVAQPDSVATIVNFIGSRQDGWQRLGPPLGVEMLADLYAGSTLIGRFGFVDLGPDEKHFIVRRAGDRAARPATEAEFNNFLALFGMSREVVP